MNNTYFYGLLDDHSAAIAACARAAFERDYPAAAATLGTDLQSTFEHAVDAFIDVYITGLTTAWDEQIPALLATECGGAGVLVDLPLGVSRAACDWIVETSAAGGDTPDARRLVALEAAGDTMACRFLELYQERHEGFTSSSEKPGGE